MKVAISRAASTAYLEKPPYHPGELFPELRAHAFEDVEPENTAYAAVRDAFHLLGLDAAAFGTAAWNPLGAYVKPGDRVVIKPNLVTHEYGSQTGQRCLTTHGSVIRAVVDYAYIAAGPAGTIVIADAPVQSADFEKLLEQNGLAAIRDFYRDHFGYSLGVFDLRQIRAVIDEQSALIRRVDQLDGDPKGYAIVEMGGESRLGPLDETSPRYAVGDYDAEVTNRRHRLGHHEYVIGKTILEADVIISMPKLKTHSKVGVTVALKNMVGIVGSKDCLPHHRHGLDGKGGDEFPRNYPGKWLFAMRAYERMQGRVPQPVWRLMRKVAGKLLRAGTPSRESASTPGKGFFPSGSWYGNDTIWRTVDDLNRILYFYSTATARFEQERQRRYLAVVDGITSMEGNGPLKGSPRRTGIVFASDDPLALDVTAATFMGLDWRRMNMLTGIAEGEAVYTAFRGKPEAIQIVSNDPKLSSIHDLVSIAPHLAPVGWRDHVELTVSQPGFDGPSS